MNLESFDYFKKIAEIKSISKVSQESHISQSALSQIIQKMEDDIGYRLFERSNKGVELTEMGHVVLNYANIITKTYNKMLSDLECIDNHQCHVIINSTWAISQYSLPCLLGEMKNKYSYINYELRSNRSEDIIENVKHGIVDFGIIYGDPNCDQIKTIPFGNDRIILVANKDYNISDKISVNMLSNYNLINFSNGCYYRDVKYSLTKLMESSQAKHYEFNPLLSLDSISAVKSSISEGYGLSFLPFSSVKKELNENRFKVIDIEDINLNMKVNIIKLEDDKLNPSLVNIIDSFLKLGPKSLC